MTATTSQPKKTPLNPQAQILDAASEEIRRIVKDAFLMRDTRERTNRLVWDVVRRAVGKLTVPALKDAARRSLLDFYGEQVKIFDAIPVTIRDVMIAYAFLSGYSRVGTMTRREAVGIIGGASGLPPDEIIMDKGAGIGQPMHKWYKEYTDKYVKPTLDRLMREIPRDPDDLRRDSERRNSLRNRAEMEVRYDDHLRQIEDFRAKGTKLVIASTHADCSDRCRPWQGRVYSLDGTSGTAPDGRKYVPLEDATDIFYTTKAGKVYKNGLLGFNCRHFLVEYQPFLRFPRPSAEKQREEYKITLTQRQMERDVRRLRVEADTWRGIDADRARKATKQAAEAYSRYRDFSRAHDRAYYPSRVQI